MDENKNPNNAQAQNNYYNDYYYFKNRQQLELHRSQSCPLPGVRTSATAAGMFVRKFQRALHFLGYPEFDNQAQNDDCTLRILSSIYEFEHFNVKTRTATKNGNT